MFIKKIKVAFSIKFYDGMRKTSFLYFPLVFLTKGNSGIINVQVLRQQIFLFFCLLFYLFFLILFLIFLITHFNTYESQEYRVKIASDQRLLRRAVIYMNTRTHAHLSFSLSLSLSLSLTLYIYIYMYRERWWWWWWWWWYFRNYI